MKAYLYFEDNPYKQNPFDFFSNTQQTTDTASNKRIEIKEEPSLLPNDIPKEYLEFFPEKILFHVHCFMEVTRIRKGRAIYIVDNKLCYLQSGEIIVFNPFVPHAWLYLDNDVENTDYSFSNVLLTESLNPVLHSRIQEASSNAFSNLYLNIWHTKSATSSRIVITNSSRFVIKDDFLITLINSTFRYAYIKLIDPMHSIFIDLLNDIDAEGREKQFAYEYTIYAKLMELVTQLFRFHLNSRLKPIKDKPEILMSALEYISENLHQDLRLETVANHCYLTPQYFSAYFKKHTGMNFSKYLSKLRLEYALNELVKTDKSILEIIFQCGFNSKTSFYRAWYSRHKISPAQLRDAYKRKE